LTLVLFAIRAQTGPRPWLWCFIECNRPGASCSGVRTIRRLDVTYRSSRREFIRDLGLGTAALPFILNLPSLGFANQQRRKQRLVVMFSPNGVVPSAFWPDEEGSKFTLKESLKPLEPFRERTLILHGVCDRVRGDGDAH